MLCKLIIYLPLWLFVAPSYNNNWLMVTVSNVIARIVGIFRHALRREGRDCGYPMQTNTIRGRPSLRDMPYGAKIHDL